MAKFTSLRKVNLIIMTLDKMNHKFIYVIVILLISTFTCCNSSQSDNLIELKPVAKQADGEYIYAKPMDVAEIEAFKQVLDEYNIDYLVKDNKIYIRESIASDKELIKNFTTKARDSAWLKAH